MAKIKANTTATYYLIDNTHLGKHEDGNYYIYKGASWTPDTKHTITDHLIGYDPTEPEGSPYAIGNTSIMDTIKTISEAQAIQFINQNTNPRPHSQPPQPNT